MACIEAVASGTGSFRGSLAVALQQPWRGPVLDLAESTAERLEQGCIRILEGRDARAMALPDPWLEREEPWEHTAELLTLAMLDESGDSQIWNGRMAAFAQATGEAHRILLRAGDVTTGAEGVIAASSLDRMREVDAACGTLSPRALSRYLASLPPDQPEHAVTVSGPRSHGYVRALMIEALGGGDGPLGSRAERLASLEALRAAQEGQGTWVGTADHLRLALALGELRVHAETQGGRTNFSERTLAGARPGLRGPTIVVLDRPLYGGHCSAPIVLARALRRGAVSGGLVVGVEPHEVTMALDDHEDADKRRGLPDNERILGNLLGCSRAVLGIPLAERVLHVNALDADEAGQKTDLASSLRLLAPIWRSRAALLLAARRADTVLLELQDGLRRALKTGERPVRATPIRVAAD